MWQANENLGVDSGRLLPLSSNDSINISYVIQCLRLIVPSSIVTLILNEYALSLPLYIYIYIYKKSRGLLIFTGCKSNRLFNLIAEELEYTSRNARYQH